MRAIDEQQLALAARHPIALGHDAVEHGAVERRQRADLAPVAEAVARGETPAERAEIVRGEGERGRGGDAEDAEVGALVALDRDAEGLGDAAAADAQREAEEL